jgi:hypothetical protein
MPETINLLEQATSNEATKFLARVANLENDDLYTFIHAVAELKNNHGSSAINDIIFIARNVKGIDAALESFYVS